MDEWGLIYHLTCDRLMKWYIQWCWIGVMMDRWGDRGVRGECKCDWADGLCQSLTAICPSFSCCLWSWSHYFSLSLPPSFPFFTLSSWYVWAEITSDAWDFLGFTHTSPCGQAELVVGNPIPTQEVMAFQNSELGFKKKTVYKQATSLTRKNNIYTKLSWFSLYIKHKSVLQN